jgi:predicted methyltransferase
MSSARDAAARAALLVACAALALLAGCATAMSTRSETAAALDRILAGEHRSAANRARDEHRHPKETLLFFGIRPEMHVVEVWPGGGWYTEIIAPLVREKGKYYAAHWEPNPDSKFITDALKSYRDKLALRPDLYDKVEITALGPSGGEIAPPGSVDLVVTFRNIHNWMARDWAPQAFAAMHRALKPGGVLGVVEHRGNPAVPQDPKARSGYVNEDYAVKMIEAAGFRLVGKSEVNANPRDTKDYEQGVWTLPPTFRLGDQDREKYAAIGESDRFTLKFVKPPTTSP